MQRIKAESKKFLGCLVDGRYRLSEIVGIGGLGTVYKATNIGTGAAVAVKLMHSNMDYDESVIDRFKREAAIINRLNHPNIVHILSYGTVDGSYLSGPLPYLALEFLTGRSLEELLSESAALSEMEALRIIKTLSCALSEAHRLGIVHRDIKPSNVMVLDELSHYDRQDSDTIVEPIKLLDFGIAKVIYSSDSWAKELTQPGYIFGSPLYMSPEQCKGLEVDSSSDIYSLGCLYFQLLTGRAPFKGESALSTIAMHLYETAPKLSSLMDSPPRKGIEELIASCLSKRKEERPRSAKEVLLKLDCIYESST